MRKVSVVEMARVSYVLGLAVATWDRLLALEVSGFHLKLAYLFLSCSLVLALVGRLKAGRTGGGRALSAWGMFKPLFLPPWLFWLVFAALCFGLTPFSPVVKKSAGYSLWAAFDLAAFGVAGIELFACGRADEERWRKRLIDGWIAGIALVGAVAIVDFVAFFFGARQGLIGFLQPNVLEWTGGVLPRPQAFSYEPSYLALAICFAQPTLMIRLLLGKGFQKAALAQFLVLSVALVLIFSRTGFALLALEAAGVLALLFSRVSHARKMGFLAGLGALMAVAFYLIPSPQRRAIQQRFFTSLLQRTDVSYQGRVYVFVNGLRIARQNLLGSGPGSAQARWLESFAPQVPLSLFRQNQTSMMSVWPEILIEEGVAGLALVAAFLIGLGIRLWGNPSLEARGILIAYAAVAGFALFLMPTIFRADLWSLIAVSGVFAQARRPAAGAPESAQATAAPE